MAESEEALQLKRRARRRLIGAIALVTFAIIVLPLVLDKEPGPSGPPLSVQIPSQESGGFNARVGPAAPAARAPEAKSEAAPVKADAPALNAAAAAAKPEPEAAKAEEVNAPAKAEELRAQAAIRDEAWVVALDAFAERKNVAQLRSKLSAAGVKSYTESVKTGKGELTRVRAGPYASKEAAEKARVKLEAMGLKPGAVTSR